MSRRRGAVVRWCATVALLAMTGVGCGHVTIAAAPPVNAPFSDRVAYFRQHRTRTRVQQTDPQTFRFTPTTIGLELANGQFVTRPGDLLPAVDPRSRVAELGRAAVDREQFSTRLQIGGFSAVALGASIALIGFAVNHRMDTVVTAVGASTAGAGLIVGMLSTMVGRAPPEETAECFDSFDAALRDRLGIAVRRRQTAVDQRSTSDR